MIKQRSDMDCLVCCISEITGIDYEDIPKFYEFYPENGYSPEYYHKMYDAWLTKNGYFRFRAFASYDLAESVVVLPRTSQRKIKAIGILERENLEYSHAVVLDIDLDDFTDDSIKMYDPDDDSEYDIKDIVEIEYLIKIENNGGKL